MQEHEQKKDGAQWPAVTVWHSILWNQSARDIVLEYFHKSKRTLFALAANTCYLVKYPLDIELRAYDLKLERHRLFVFMADRMTSVGELPFDVKQVTTAALEGYLGNDLVYDVRSGAWINDRLYNLLEQGLLQFDAQKHVFRDIHLPECPSKLTYMSLL